MLFLAEVLFMFIGRSLCHPSVVDGLHASILISLIMLFALLLPSENSKYVVGDVAPQQGDGLAGA